MQLPPNAGQKKVQCFAFFERGQAFGRWDVIKARTLQSRAACVERGFERRQIAKGGGADRLARRLEEGTGPGGQKEAPRLNHPHRLVRDPWGFVHRERSSILATRR